MKIITYHWILHEKYQKNVVSHKKKVQEREMRERDGCLFQRSASDWRVHCTSLRGRGRRLAASLALTKTWAEWARRRTVHFLWNLNFDQYSATHALGTWAYFRFIFTLISISKFLYFTMISKELYFV